MKLPTSVIAKQTCYASGGQSMHLPLCITVQVPVGLSYRAVHWSAVNNCIFSILLWGEFDNGSKAVLSGYRPACRLKERSLCAKSGADTGCMR